MSGHSKWATTKHKKAIIDSRRAKSFAKLIKNIEVAARMGGPDLAGNPGLELAVTKAKKTSVPNDNIDRAIKRGAGLTGEVVDYTEIMYEARGPQGSALFYPRAAQRADPGARPRYGCAMQCRAGRTLPRTRCSPPTCSLARSFRRGS